MKGGGAGGLTVGLALVRLSVFGLRQRTAAALWILPLLALTYLTTMNYATYYMNSTTQGGPPLGVGMSLMGISLVSGILSYLGRAPRSAA